MADMSASATQEIPVTGSGKLVAGSLSRISVATMNRLLGILTAVVLVIFIFTLLVGGFKLMGVGGHIRDLEAKGAKAAAAAEPAKQFVKQAPVDAALNNRNIFQPAGVAVAASGDAAGSSASNTYRLVGISAAKDPADTFVMIENSQSKLTYFLQYNQPVEGLELERILEDKVIVKIGGKAVEFE